MGVGLDEMFDALGAIERRRVLVRLVESSDGSIHGIGDDEAQVEFVEDPLSMEHVHLPKLEDYGFIEWDRDNQVVEKGDHFDELELLIELLCGNEDRLPDDWL